MERRLGIFSALLLGLGCLLGGLTPRMAEHVMAEDHIPPEIVKKHDEEEDVDYYEGVPVSVDYVHLGDHRLFPAVFSDEIFFKPSTDYHHLLAKQSIGMALSAFTLYDADEGDETRSSYQGTLLDYLANTNFSTIRIDDYLKDTSAYTIGSVIACKDISYKGEEATLLAVAIRGGRYKKEWESNFTLGNAYIHEGFRNAAELIVDRIFSFIGQTPNLKKNIKIWITGFSRAAAVANIAAAKLNDSPTFGKEQVYAYTFAAPRPVDSHWVDPVKGYENIFNILGASDIIPQFVPAQWGYAHFGNDLYLPGAEFDSRFKKKYALIQQQIHDLGGETYYVPELYFRLRLVYGLLLEISKNDLTFTKLLQPIFIQIMQNSGANSMLELLRQTLITLSDKDLGINETKDQLIDYALCMLQPLLMGTGYMKGQISSGKGGAMLVVHEHFPELYIHWMYSFGPEDLFNGSHSFDYLLLGQGRFGVVDKTDGNLVLKLDNGTLTPSSGDIELATFPIDGKTMVVLPHDRPYEVRYHLDEGQVGYASTLPYGRFFVSTLSRVNFTLDDTVTRDGLLMYVDGQGESVYHPKQGVVEAYTPNQYIKDLHIDKLAGMSYRFLVVLIGLVLALIIIALIWVLAFVHRLVSRVKMRPARLGIVSAIVLFAVEGEVCYWFSGDLLVLNLIFKSLAALSVLALYFLGKKLSTFRHPEKTVLPFLLLILSGSIVMAASYTAGLILTALAFGYLCYFTLRRKRPTPHLWIIYGAVAAIIFGVAAIALTRWALPLAIGIPFLAMIPPAILSIFGCADFGGRKEASGLAIGMAMFLLGIYLFSLGALPVVSMLYIVTANLAYILFAISFDTEEKIPLLDEGGMIENVASDQIS